MPYFPSCCTWLELCGTRTALMMNWSSWRHIQAERLQ
jgi:hypothetical protein